MNGDDHIELSEEEKADMEAEIEEGYADIEEQSVYGFMAACKHQVTILTTCRYAVDTTTGFENVIVVDNIPIVDESKKQRLVDRLRQVFDKAGASIDEERVSMPWDESAATNKG